MCVDLAERDCQCSWYISGASINSCTIRPDRGFGPGGEATFKTIQGRVRETTTGTKHWETKIPQTSKGSMRGSADVTPSLVLWPTMLTCVSFVCSPYRLMRMPRRNRLRRTSCLLTVSFGSPVSLPPPLLPPSRRSRLTEGIRRPGRTQGTQSLFHADCQVGGRPVEGAGAGKTGVVRVQGIRGKGQVQRRV